MTEISEDTPTWEMSKENVLPIKRGRKVKGLHIHEKTDTDLEFEEMEFKENLTDLEPGAEKLNVWLEYLKWARGSFPSSSIKTLEVLESCTNDLKGCKELRNDPAFVKVWIEYADLVQTPGEVFSFMQANKIGIRVALFWIAWAFVAEKLKNYSLTDKIFQKGIKMHAEPKQVMAKRYQQFQRRLARHYINMAESGESSLPPSTSTSSSSTRRVLGHAGGSEEQHTTSRSKSHRETKDNFNIFCDETSKKVKDHHEVGDTAANVSWKSLGDERSKSKENAGRSSQHAIVS